jgi:GDP-L-fucose synthase
MTDKQKNYVAGHLGMEGSAIVKQLNEAGYQNIVVRTYAELDLCYSNLAWLRGHRMPRLPIY